MLILILTPITIVQAQLELVPVLIVTAQEPASTSLASKLVEHVNIALAVATPAQMLLTIQILTIIAVVLLAVVIVAMGLALMLQMVLLVARLEMRAQQRTTGAMEVAHAPHRVHLLTSVLVSPARTGTCVPTGAPRRVTAAAMRGGVFPGATPSTHAPSRCGRGGVARVSTTRIKRYR